jgi:hypothetical protein
MALFIYPHTAEDLSTGSACCAALSLPSPVAWGDDLYEQSIADLVGQRIPSANQRLNTLGAPVIILACVDREQLAQVLAWYKSQGQWPIFATLTEQSLKMTFRELLSHLIQDRAQEAAARRTKKM